MSDASIRRTRLLPDGTVVQVLPDGSTRPVDERSDWQWVDAMTDEEIEAAARSDPDNPPLTENELQRFETVLNVKAIRKQLKLTQAAFAETFHLSLSTVRDWEQGRFVPDRAARTLLKVIAHNPEAVKEALAK